MHPDESQAVGHAIHASVPPIEYFPDPQAVHVPLENPYPAIHDLHFPVDAVQLPPHDSTQSLHSFDPAVEYLPFSQFVHPLFLVFGP